MKIMIWMVGCLLVVATAFGQHESHGAAGCDCSSCLEKTESGQIYTLPGLQGLVKDEQAGCDHDHAAEEAGHDEHCGPRPWGR